MWAIFRSQLVIHVLLFSVNCLCSLRAQKKLRNKWLTAELTTQISIFCLLAKGMSQFWLFHNDIFFSISLHFFSNEIKVVFNLWKYQYFIHLATKSSTRLNFWQQQIRIFKEKMTDRFDIKDLSLSSFINFEQYVKIYFFVLRWQFMKSTWKVKIDTWCLLANRKRKSVNVFLQADKSPLNWSTRIHCE